MTDYLMTNARIITQARCIEHGWLLVRDGHIGAYGPGLAPHVDGAEQIEAGGYTLLPGFIDIHVHGGVGHDTMNANADGLRAMARFYARNGVTGFLATTWTDSRQHIYNAMATVARIMGPQPDGATLHGVHMEGPYLNADYCGAQNPAHMRTANREEMLALFELGVIRLLALAPEFSANHWLIRECVRRGITVSVAHSAATYNEMQHALDLGLSQATHMYNAMTGLHHRQPGIVGAVLTTPHVRAELIADLVHVHAAAMQLLWKAKGPDGVILITDAIRASGMPDGDYAVDDRVMHVRQGVCKLDDGTLAGSIVTMNVAVRNFMGATGEPLERIWQATSLNAARAVHLAHRTGSIENGKDADLVLVDAEVNVLLTMAGGRVVYRRTEENATAN